MLNEQIVNRSYANLKAAQFLGHIFIFLNNINVNVGKSTPGIGMNILEQQVSMTAILPASLEIPYSIVPLLFLTGTPCWNSFLLITATFVAFAVPRAIMFINVLASINLLPFKWNFPVNSLEDPRIIELAVIIDAEKLLTMSLVVMVPLKLPPFLKFTIACKV